MKFVALFLRSLFLCVFLLGASTTTWAGEEPGSPFFTKCLEKEFRAGAREYVRKGAITLERRLESSGWTSFLAGCVGACAGGFIPMLIPGNTLGPEESVPIIAGGLLAGVLAFIKKGILDPLKAEQKIKNLLNPQKIKIFQGRNLSEVGLADLYLAWARLIKNGEAFNRYSALMRVIAWLKNREDYSHLEKDFEQIRKPIDPYGLKTRVQDFSKEELIEANLDDFILEFLNIAYLVDEFSIKYRKEYKANKTAGNRLTYKITKQRGGKLVADGLEVSPEILSFEFYAVQSSGIGQPLDHLYKMLSHFQVERNHLYPFIILKFEKNNALKNLGSLDDFKKSSLGQALDQSLHYSPQLFFTNGDFQVVVVEHQKNITGDRTLDETLSRIISSLDNTKELKIIEKLGPKLNEKSAKIIYRIHSMLSQVESITDDGKEWISKMLRILLILEQEPFSIEDLNELQKNFKIFGKISPSDWQEIIDRLQS